MSELVLLLSFLTHLTSAQDLQCHVQGQCTGLFTGLTGTNSYNDCLQTCQSSMDCNWFTFTSHNECFEYVDCPSIDDGCSDCFTGQKECQSEGTICGVHGMCEGHVVAYNTTSSAFECVKLCQQFEDCLWYSYFASTQTCVLIAECVSIDQSCDDCTTGQRDCFEELNFDLLMVVGGQGAERKVELIDLSGANRTCPQPSDFSGAAYGSVGTFIGGKVIVCGGNDTSSFDYSNKCYFYDPSTDQWNETASMSVERGYVASVLLSPTEWWITGGYNFSGEMASTEVYNSMSESFLPGVSLPETKSRHNIVRINETHFMLLGDYDEVRDVWMFDKTVGEWTKLPDTLEGRNGGHAGLVTYPDGRHAVVVAGSWSTSKSTEIFDLATQTWTYGPDLPVDTDLSDGASVQLESTFLVVGGQSSGVHQDSIYSFDPELEQWAELSQKLEVARHYSASFLVPGDFITCI